MSFFGALFKPFKKLIKKIGKGIKKVAKKIGKAVGKLGIVGQIGMIFLMPYAVGALGSFFGASGTLSSWGATLLKSSKIGVRALGHTLNAVNTVGTMAGKAYTTVTDTISNAFNSVVNTGKKGLTKMGFGKGVNVPADALASQTTAIESGQLLDSSLRTPVNTNLMRIKPTASENVTKSLFENYQKDLAQNAVATGSTSATSSDLIAAVSGGASGTASSEIVTNSLLTATPPVIAIPTPNLPNVAGDTLIDKTKSFLSEQVQAGFTSAKEKLGAEIQGVITAPVDAITGKAKEAVGVKTLEMLGLEEPQAGEEHGRYDPFSRFTTTDSGIDFTNSYTVNAFAQQGNNTVPYGLANRNYVSNFFDPNSNASANDFMTQYYVGANVNRQLGVTP